MNNAIDAEQASSNMMLMEITPFIPLKIRGMGGTLIFERELVEKLN